MLQFEDIGSVFEHFGSSQASSTAPDDSKSGKHGRKHMRKEPDYYDDDDE